MIGDSKIKVIYSAISDVSSEISKSAVSWRISHFVGGVVDGVNRDIRSNIAEIIHWHK